MQPFDPSQRNVSKTKRGWMMMIFAVALMIALSSAYISVQRQKSGEARNLSAATAKDAAAPRVINAIRIQNSPATIPLKLPGETAAWFASIIYARVDGYVGKWYADIGDHVRKGQVLATIDTPDLDAQLAAAQAKFKASLAMIASREAEANFAKSTYERWRDSPKGVVSEQEREAKKANFESAVAHLNEAKAQSGLDRANLDRFKALAEFKQVTAPYEGVITERRIDIGNLVTAGSSANTAPLYRMEQNNPIRIFVDVPQSAARDMEIGTPAQIQANNIPDRIFTGKISRTSEAINPQSRTLRVEVDIPNLDLALVPGMYVDVSFEIPSAGLMQIPAAALIFRSSGPQVAVVDDEGKIAFKKVTIVRDYGNIVELGSGVSPEDRIALNISSQIAEGERVTVNDTENGDDTHAAKP
jgi:RND family efflux transporter MFP subunit